jgi:homoserine dehydrogenase
VSGTLGFVLSSLEAGMPFSSAVREAVKLGHAEPDPREDLSGADVLRKGLILARLLGFAGLAPRAQSLVSKAHARLPLDVFLKRLPEADAGWRELVATQAARGQVLRYVVVATGRGVRAGLKAVPRASAFGSLSGTRNLLSFTTRRYHAEPLVVAGPGAGPEVTAAGILNDIQSLAGE